MKFLAIATFGILFSSVATGQVISQYITSKATGGGAVDLYALELFNHTPSTVQYAIGGLDVYENGTKVWTNGSAITMGPREVIVITSNTDLSNYISTNSVSEVFTSGFLNGGFTFGAGHTVAVSFDEGATTYDRVGNPIVNNKGAGNDNVNYERDLEFLFTPIPGGCWDGSGNISASTPSFSQGFSQSSLISHASGTYDIDDFEGFGIPPGNIRFNGTTWSTPANVTGSATPPTTTNNCVIEMAENSTGVIDDSHNVKDLIVRTGSTVTLGATSSGYSQAKRVVRSRGQGTIKGQKYIGTDGWHLIGTPFPDGFANSEGRGANALYWYWNGSGWTQGTAGAGGVPAGLGLMVRVGSAFTYSYTGGGAGTITTGNGGTSDVYQSFTWATTGGDGVLQYLSDGHSSVSQGSGWNLLSNPFTCALDWNSLYDNGGTSNIDATIYIWDPSASGWITYNAATNVGTGVQDGLIPPYGAFLVKQTAAGSASVTASADSHGSLIVPTSSYNKYTSYDTDVIQVSLTDVSSSASSFYMISDYTQGNASYDAGLDTWAKNTLGDNIPDIYQTDGNFGEISQNLTNLSMPQSIPLETSDLSSGKTYAIGIEQFVDANDYHVSLEDTYLNAMTDLTNGAYTFTQPSEAINDRFIIHINQNNISVEEADIDTHYSYILNDAIYFNPGDLNVKSVFVYSIDGKLICKSSEITGPTELCQLYARGTYILEIISEEGIFNEKVQF